MFVGLVNLKAQNPENKFWLKFRALTDIPNCDSGNCLHPDTAFQSVLSEIGANNIDLALPAIDNFPQATLYGLDLVYEITFTDSLVSTKESLESLEAIEYVEFVPVEIDLSVPNDYDLLDSDFGENWQLDLIHAPDAWDYTKDAHHITIAINESGLIDSEHEDLQANISNPGSGNVSYHKTFVAGCASARTNNGLGLSSIGYNAKILNAQGGTNGMLSAAAAGARIINCSYMHWSQVTEDCVGPFATVQNAINMLADDGIIIVAAAGNGSTGLSCLDPNGYAYPASYDNVISVSSVGEDNNHYDPLDQGSHTHNDKVDICAPGYNVLSTHPNNGYSRSTGTSLASPIVAGTVALLLNINPCLDQDDILQILQASADPIDDAGDFPPNSLGAGRLNAYQACLLALQTVDVDQNNNVITGTETWTNNVTVGQDLHIEPGASLTLTGTLHMSPGKKIFVKRGAEFIVDGGKITNSTCGNHFWQGIEVWGTTTESQFPETSIHQGLLKLIDAEIENAAQGIIN